MGKYDREPVKETKEKILPIIRDLSWILPSDLSDKKIDIGKETESGGVKRVQIIYKHDSGKKPLVLTQIRDDSAYFRTNGVEEDSYIVPKTGVRTMLGRNVVKLYMDKGNEHHDEFYEVLSRIRNVVKKKLDKDSGKRNANVTIKGLYDTMDDEKRVTGHALVAKLIESRDGEVYTAAYDDEEQIDVTTVGRSIVRPALIFGYTIPEEDTDEYRISVSITQMYVKSSSLFPLRDRD